MIGIFSVLVGGIIAGRLLAGRRLRFAPAAVTAIVWAMLFLLGAEVGSDPAVRRGAATLGAKAFALFAASTAGSVAAAWALGRLLLRRRADRAAQRHTRRPEETPAGNIPAGQAPAGNAPAERGCSGSIPAQQTTTEDPGTGDSLREVLRGSATIVAFFAAGCAAGAADLLPAVLAQSHASHYALLALMAAVGITLGHDPTLAERIRQLDPRMALLPLATAAGTLGGAALAAPWLDGVTTADALAVGAGFGYYSLSSIFIADLRSVELGSVALLCNILRELFTLLFAAGVARRFGPLAAVSIGGATSFDTTLPAITRAAGRPYVVVAIFHGCVLDFSVPWLVTLFCSLA